MCRLTKESDILIALRGIALEVGHVMGDCLIAGLWKEHFIQELCWRNAYMERRPSQWQAPSWSWASMLGFVFPGARTRSALGDSREMATITKFCVSTKTSGVLERASIFIDCRPISVSVRHSIAGDGCAWCTLARDTWSSLDNLYSNDLSVSEGGKQMEDLSSDASSTSTTSDWIGGQRKLPGIPLDEEELRPYGVFQVQLDDPADPRNPHAVLDIQLLVLLRFDHPHLELEGILVADSNHQPGTFKRVGHFNVLSDNATTVLAAYEQTEVQTLELV
jgi:hypothetical protein